jgi:putative endonuclease
VKTTPTPATEATPAPQDVPARSWLVYIVANAAGAFYTGITTDMDRRLAEHRGGRRGARFFRMSAASRLLYTEEHPSRASASSREAAIKRMTRSAKQALIDADAGRTQCGMHRA